MSGSRRCFQGKLTARCLNIIRPFVTYISAAGLQSSDEASQNFSGPNLPRENSDQDFKMQSDLQERACSISKLAEKVAVLKSCVDYSNCLTLTVIVRRDVHFLRGGRYGKRCIAILDCGIIYHNSINTWSYCPPLQVLLLPCVAFQMF